MGWNERSDPDMRTANFCDVYREGVYSQPQMLKVKKKFGFNLAFEFTLDFQHLSNYF